MCAYYVAHFFTFFLIAAGSFLPVAGFGLGSIFAKRYLFAMLAILLKAVAG